LAGAAQVAPLSAQEAPDHVALTTAVDSIAQQELATGRVAGLTIAVARNGELILDKGYGYADLENELPATARSVYRIGSITKQFTAAAILRLVDEGKLSLDDELTKFLPDYFTGGRKITIHHLLTHTSGIKSYTSLGPKWRTKMRLDLTHDELVGLFMDEPFDFEPGEKYLYNNSGYYLLGMIIEKITGQSYGDYLEEVFFRPLGLESTRYCDETPLIRYRARGYAPSLTGLVNAQPISMNQPYAAGSLCASAADLVRWQEALSGGEVVSGTSYELMTTPAMLNDGSPTNYG
jgi:CubicO group peptidase (beta-lactamase class C family)